MPPVLRFLARRLATIPITLLIVTAALYALLMLAPPQQRAQLYLPPQLPSRLTEEDVQRLLDEIVRHQGLDDPYPVQYARWLLSLARGEWGYSPVQNQDVLAALVGRLPVTAELTLYSVAVFVPLGLLAGVHAARRTGQRYDGSFRFAAFLGTSLPPFVLGFLLLSIFYVALGWFPPWRLSLANDLFVRSMDFRTITGLLTIDGLLNGRPDISVDALRHLVLPVMTLSLSHWATLGRLTRASVLEELEKAYVVSARARGLPDRQIVWRHAFHNALIPALNSTALSAASLVTGVFVVEVVFAFRGLSQLITAATIYTPDIPMAVGFAVFSVLLVLPLMILLDLIQAAVDPRLREGISEP